MILIGEVALSGEVRPVSQIEARIKEAKLLGFKRCFIPKANLDQNLSSKAEGIELVGLRKAEEIMGLLFS
jgi:DNA repair protein RadA/Sms